MKTNKIRYKYKPSQDGFRLEQVRCPTCENGINWTKVVQDKSWNGTIILLAECWDGGILSNAPRHLFLIELENLPIVKIEKKPK